MVLDEDALEAMLKRQNAQAAQDPDEDPKESKQVELTDQTEEFEVYEKEPGTSKTGPGLRAIEHEPQAPVLPEAFQEPEPEPTPEPAPEPVVEAPVAPAPEPIVDDEPEPEPVDDPPAPERPRVWPPLSSSKEPEPAPEPAMPEPVIESPSEPEPAAVADVSADDDKHSHAHADLDVDGGGVKIAIVQALFNQDITDMMADLAVAKANKRGAKVTHHVTVPGVFDLPLVTARLLERDDVDCAVVLGVVVQGETSHDEVITNATARTLQQLSLDVDKPIGFGVIGPGMTWAQAEARVANGAHAVDAALAQVELTRSL